MAGNAAEPRTVWSFLKPQASSLKPSSRSGRANPFALVLLALVVILTVAMYWSYVQSRQEKARFQEIAAIAEGHRNEAEKNLQESFAQRILAEKLQRQLDRSRGQAEQDRAAGEEALEAAQREAERQRELAEKNRKLAERSERKAVVAMNLAHAQYAQVRQELASLRAELKRLKARLAARDGGEKSVRPAQ